VVGIVVPDPIKLAELTKAMGMNNKSHQELCKSPKVRDIVLEKIIIQSKVVFDLFQIFITVWINKSYAWNLDGHYWILGLNFIYMAYVPMK